MTRRIALHATIAVSLWLFTAVGQAQTPTPRPASASLLSAFDVWAGTLQTLQVPDTPGKPFSVVVSLGGTPRTMDLKPYDVRSSSFRLLVEDAQGMRQVPTPPSVTYRGELRGLPGSVVAASLIGGQLKAYVAMPDGQTWGVQHVDEVDAAAPRDQYIVYDDANRVNRGHKCGNVELQTQATSAPGVDMDRIAEIGIDADYAFYLQNGSSTTQTQNDITAVINGMSVIYLRDVQIDFQITTILVRTTNTIYTNPNPGSLLTQFRNQWNAFHGNIQRDLAHLFTGINLSGTTIGIARLSSVCNLSIAYGLSQSRYTSNFTSRIALTAHECGHNFSAQHCDNFANCNIMCSGLGGCARNITSLGPTSIGSISAFRNTRTCLAVRVLTPRLTSISPSSAPALTPGTMVLTGQNLDTVTTVNIGFTKLTSRDFRVISSSQLQVTLPKPTALGGNLVSVENPAGTSNFVIFSYQLTSPQEIKAPLVGTGGLPFVWEIGGNPNDQYLLLIGFGNNNTFTFMNFNILTSFGVLTFGNLNGAGIVDITVMPPVGPLVGITTYSQSVFFDQTGSTFTGATNIAPTFWVR